MRRREEMSFLEKIYLVEIVRGVTITFSRLLRNFVLHVAHEVGLLRSVPADATVSYPDERRPYPTRYRGRHRLTLNDDGSIRCTACFLCATACPARCIYIEAAESPNKQVEKFPHRYEIDTLLCIYCGYCVEACPVDAIRMDTGLHPEVYQPDPRLFIEDKEVLMSRSRELVDRGSDNLFEAHLQKMRALATDPMRE